MSNRKAIPPTVCDYLIRMHLESIRAITRYMSNGCRSEGLHDSMNACVEMIRLRDLLNKTLDEYSYKKEKNEINQST